MKKFIVAVVLASTVVVSAVAYAGKDKDAPVLGSRGWWDSVTSTGSASD